MFALHLSRDTAIFVVDCCQFGPSWIFGLKMELMACAHLTLTLLIVANLAQAGCLGWKWSLWPVPTWLEVQRSKDLFFLTLNVSINYMKHFRNCLHHTSAVPQPFLLLVAANLALAGFLGWKWRLWSVPTWLEVQRSKDVFFLTLYDSINDMTYFLNVCITPQPCHRNFCCSLLPIWP